MFVSIFKLTAQYRIQRPKMGSVLLTQYSSVDQIEKNEMGWACSTYGEGRGVYRILVGRAEGKGPLGDPGVEVSIIVRWVFRRWDLGVRTGSSWLRIGTGDGYL